MLVATPKWKNRPLKEVLTQERLFAYHPEDPTGFDYLKQFGLLKHLARPRLYVNENQALLNFLAAGAGFGLLPRELAEEPIRQNKLALLNQGKALKIEMALAWYPRVNPPAYFVDLIAAIK